MRFKSQAEMDTNAKRWLLVIGVSAVLCVGWVVGFILADIAMHGALMQILGFRR